MPTPYDDSSDEEQMLLKEMDDAYSQSSSSSSTIHSESTYASEQRLNFGYGQNSRYTKSRRHLDKLLKSRNDMELIEAELEEERSRGRYLLVACVVMSVLCGFLFADKWPEDWRGALIETLEKGRPAIAKSNETIAVDDAENNEKDPVTEFYKGEDDDDHYSKYGTSAIERYKAMQNKMNKNKKTSPKAIDVMEEEKDDDDDDLTIPHPLTKQEQIEENEQQHIDNLSKYLKWNLPYKRDRDIALYWNIPLTGTMYVDEILGRCYKLVQASDDASIIEGHEKDGIIHVLTIDPNNKKYVNVNMGSISGIKHAKALHLASSGTVEVIRTSYIYEADFLFEQTPKYGKCFTMMRDPIQRSIDVFFKLKESSSNEVFQEMTIGEYVHSSYCEDNWMVRVLSNEMEGPLKKQHLDLAKHILGRKFLVGITEKFEESIKRFTKYFQWDDEVADDEISQCLDEELELSKQVETNAIFAVSQRSEIVKTGTEVYRILQQKNSFDIELYQYAKSLYNTQSIYT